MWATDPSINEVITSAWRSASSLDVVGNLLLKIETCSAELQRWDEEHFGKAQLEIRKLETLITQTRAVHQRKAILGEICEWRKREGVNFYINRAINKESCIQI